METAFNKDSYSNFAETYLIFALMHFNAVAQTF